MKRELGKENLKASESAPMETKQRNADDVKNQTTEVPKSRFPWVTIIIVLTLIAFLVTVVFVLDVGTA
jgi:Tfp pilus assembly protein PilN